MGKVAGKLRGQGHGEALYMKTELLALGPQGLQEAAEPHTAVSCPPRDPRP